MPAKIQKLSLKQPDAEGFRGIEPMRVDGATFGEALTPNMEVKRPRLGTFSLRREAWQVFLDDPSLRQEFERELEERVKTRLEEGAQAYRASLVEAAKAEGLAQGVAEAKAGVQEVMGRLEGICRAVIQDKQKMLREHERQWAEALHRILFRFLVPQGTAIEGSIRKWLDESIASFGNRARIKVRLSLDDFDRVSASVTPSETDRWEFVKDPSLTTGSIHCESENGGIFFSASAEAQRLEAILREYFPVEETSDVIKNA